MKTSILIRFVTRALAWDIEPVRIYNRAKTRFAASHSPARIRAIMSSMGMLIM